MTPTDTTSLHEALSADIRALGSRRGSGFWAQLALLFLSPGFLAIFLYRYAAKCHAYNTAWGKALAKILWRANVAFTSCDLRPAASIGAGCAMPHAIGIVIGLGTKIGCNAVIYQNVTIGLRHVDGDNEVGGYPTIGDDVKIFSGAVIAGPVRIGRGVTIGANAVVLQDVPDGYSAVGVPARLLPPAESRKIETDPLRRAV